MSKDKEPLPPFLQQIAGAELSNIVLVRYLGDEEDNKNGHYNVYLILGDNPDTQTAIITVTYNPEQPLLNLESFLSGMGWTFELDKIQTEWA